MSNFANAGQYIAVIGGTHDHETILSEVEVIKISDEGVVSASNCLLPELKVQYAAVSNNMICGGETPDTINQCKELNPESLKWEDRSPMNVKRSGHDMTTVNNHTTYVCGGWDDSHEYLASCEKFDGEWSFIKDLPKPLQDSKRLKSFQSYLKSFKVKVIPKSSCMIGTEDFLYLMGGEDGSVSK